MMGFLNKLKLMFARKKPPEKQDVSISAIKDTPQENNEFSQASAMHEEPPKALAVQPAAQQKPIAQPVFDPNTTGPHRDSKECPKCGAPNDQDIHKCWLCKNEI